MRDASGEYEAVAPTRQRGIDSIGLADIDWAGDHDVLLRYLKGRTGPEGLHLPKRAAALLRQWLAYSAPLRAFAEPALAEG